MKKAMLIFCFRDEGQNLKFYDDVEKAVSDADVIMTSLGGVAEVYEYVTPTEENDYDFGYQLIYAGWCRHPEAGAIWPL